MIFLAFFRFNLALRRGKKKKQKKKKFRTQSGKINTVSTAQCLTSMLSPLTKSLHFWGESDMKCIWCAACAFSLIYMLYYQHK